MALGPKPTRKAMGGCELVAELHPGTIGTLWIGQAKVGPVLARRVPRGREPKATTLDALARAADWAKVIHHPTIVRVVGSEIDDEELVLLSAFHEGEPLRSVLRLAGITRRPLPTGVTLRIAADLADALVQLHALKQDGAHAVAALNPDNVLICADGRTRVLEPGISAIAAKSAPWAQDAKRAAYDAPEALDGHWVPASDLFSIGVLVWEMLRNRPLFAGASYDAVAKRVRTAAVRRVDTIKAAGGETISSSVAEVVARALERNLEERFGSAAEMVESLQEESLSSHAEVTAALNAVAADLLARQRRKLEHASAVAPPARPSGPSRPAPTRTPQSPPAPAVEPRVIETPPPPSIDTPPASGRPSAPRISTAPRPSPKAASKQRTLLGIARLPEPVAPVAKNEEPLDAVVVGDEAPSELVAAVVSIPDEGPAEDVAFETEPPPAETPAAKPALKGQQKTIEIPPEKAEPKGKATPPPPPIRKGRKKRDSARPPDSKKPSVEAKKPPEQKKEPKKEPKKESIDAPARGFDMVALAEDESLQRAPEPTSRRGMLIGMGIGVVAIVVMIIVLRNSGEEAKPTETTKPAAPAPTTAPRAPDPEPKEEKESEYAPPSAAPPPPPSPPPPWPPVAAPPPAPVAKTPAPFPRPQPKTTPAPAPATQPKRYTPGGI